MSENTANAGQIEHDLDQTRSRLGTHLTELQGKLSPGQVIDDLLRYFRGQIRRKLPFRTWPAKYAQAPILLRRRSPTAAAMSPTP